VNTIESESKEKVLEFLRNTSIEELITAHSGRYTRPIIKDHFFSLNYYHGQVMIQHLIKVLSLNHGIEIVRFFDIFE